MPKTTQADASLAATLILQDTEYGEKRINVYVGTKLYDNYLKFDIVPDVIVAPRGTQHEVDPVRTYVLESMDTDTMEFVYQRKTVAVLSF